MSKSNKNNIFYVYVYLDPRKPGDYVYGDYRFDHEPFYVGKGSNNRAWEHTKKTIYDEHINKDFINIINDIKALNNRNPLIITFKKLLSENVAYKLEEHIVEVIGRLNIKTGPLCNKIKGGGGLKCYKHTKKVNIIQKYHHSKKIVKKSCDMKPLKQNTWKEKKIITMEMMKEKPSSLWTNQEWHVVLEWYCRDIKGCWYDYW